MQFNLILLQILKFSTFFVFIIVRSSSAKDIINDREGEFIQNKQYLIEMKSNNPIK
jgi:hypothetical protein